MLNDLAEAIRRWTEKNDSSLSTIRDVLRPESDCILIARPGAVTGLSPVITHNRYVLTDRTVFPLLRCLVLR